MIDLSGAEHLKVGPRQDLDFENPHFRWCSPSQSSRRGVDEISMLPPENVDYVLYRKVVATDCRRP